MEIINDYKKIVHSESGDELGRILFYMIDKTGKIKHIVYIDDKEDFFYVRYENIVSIKDNILVNCVSQTKPQELDDLFTVYPDTVVQDDQGGEYGRPHSFDISRKYIKVVNTDSKKFNTSDLVSATQFYLVFKKSAEPSPTPPAKSDEQSFNYNLILGKVANKSIYSCTNSPIIVAGEVIRPDNIVNAICSNKLIELIKSTQ